jgi:NADH:ubiquinone oxidoreductase subunit H
LVTLYTHLLIFLINIYIFLNLTILIATITLIERKVLSLIQRRVGPNYIGYKGRLQFIADALKLLAKHIYVLTGINKTIFIAAPAIVLIICYLF